MLVAHRLPCFRTQKDTEGLGEGEDYEVKGAQACRCDSTLGHRSGIDCRGVWTQAESTNSAVNSFLTGRTRLEAREGERRWYLRACSIGETRKTRQTAR